MSYEIINPLLPGFYPDPSIVRVEDDFYMVTSSFSYFPGVPVFHSRDLAHWEQIGHVLDRPSQLPLGADNISGGIFAPTIRYHEGTFYMITTNVDHGGNFIVTAKDPAGPWSDPHWLEDAQGIDPSLFWDDDGKAYYTGTAPGKDGRHQHIWICEINLETFRFVGERKLIWAGAMTGAWCPEAPHLYKKDGWYYLMIAEGGTEYYHAVTIARSKSVMGEYTGFDGNPILTHRHLGMCADICNTGHGDLVECRDGSWYMVLLASRPYGGYHKNMGRETFIVPVIWENGWPVAAPGTGRSPWKFQGPDLPEFPVKKDASLTGFKEGKLPLCFNFLGTPGEEDFQLADGKLKIRAVERPFMAGWKQEKQPDSREEEKKEAHMGKKDPEERAYTQISPVNCAGFVGRRQQHKSYQARISFTFAPEKKEAAGLIVLQHNYHSFRMEKILVDGKEVVRVAKGYVTLEPSLMLRGVDGPWQQEICGQIPCPEGELTFELTAEEQKNTFAVLLQDGKRMVVAENLDGGFLGSETAEGFVGAYVGMFATANGDKSGNFAEFSSFFYEGKEEGFPESSQESMFLKIST